MISVCEKGKQSEKALELFEVMRGHRLTPDVITYSAMICACKTGKQPLKAMELELFELIRGQRLTPNVITYNASISFCEKGKQPMKVMEIVDVMPRQSLTSIHTVTG